MKKDAALEWRSDGMTEWREERPEQRMLQQSNHRCAPSSFRRLLFVLFAAFLPCMAQAQGGPPQITTQPQSQTVTQGTTATFTVEVSSLSYLTYQWRFNAVNIPGATNSSYVIAAAQDTNTGDYSVAVTNAISWVISSNASLTVLTSPTITTQPSDVTKTLTGNAAFAVVSSGSGLSYQWHFNGTILPGETKPNLQLVNVQVWQAGSYSVLVSNDYGSVPSSNALLTVTLPVGTAAAWGDNTDSQSTVPPDGNFSATQSTNTSGSVSDPGEPDHCGYPPCASYWLPYTPLMSGSLSVNTIGTTFNAVLAVYTGDDLSHLMPVACSANHGQSGETVTFPATGGTRYFVVVEGVNCAVGPATVNFNLSVTFAHAVKAIAAGGAHSLVLKTNGTVLGWGDNTYRQLIVPAGLDGVSAIAAGYNHSLALRADGTAVVWGDNSFGQTNVPPDLTNVTKIVAGAYHNLALRNDGTVVAWGSNSDGQSDVPASLSNVVLIAAGYYHSLAQTSDGTIVGWGAGAHGEITPPDTLTGVVALAGGDGFSLALEPGGKVVAWGDNTYEQTNVPGELTNVAAIAAGGHHSLALKNNGTVVGWGLETNVPFVIATMTAVSAGANHSMALKGTGAPVITANPMGRHVNPGADVSLPVMVVGNGPLSFQWRLNGAGLPGATQSILALTNAQPAATGTYSVFVSNSFGFAISSDAVLIVGDRLILRAARFQGDGSFQFGITGPGGLYTVESSTDLTSWPPLSTLNAPPGTIIFNDTNAVGSIKRFYRARLQ